MQRDPSVTRAITPVASPLDVWAESDGAVCFRLDGLPCEPDRLADEILSPGERTHWLNMRAVEKRRHEWLLGRCAAKEAVRLLIERRQGLRWALAEIQIVPDAYGCPQVSLSGAGSQPAAASQAASSPSISIAHSDGTAVALAAWDRPGVDLESLRQRPEDFESIAFSADERQLLAALPGGMGAADVVRQGSRRQSAGTRAERGPAGFSYYARGCHHR